MVVAGGVYVEACVTPPSRLLLGSGGRAAMALIGRESVRLETFHPRSRTGDVFANFAPAGVEVRVHASPEVLSFDYLHPLARPRVSPVPIPRAGSVAVRAPAVLRFGCLEGDFVVDAGLAVYDPQSEAAPERFGANGSRADRLAVVLNAREAWRLTGHPDVDDAARDVIASDGAEVVVVKQGPAGARVVERGSPPIRVPAFAAAAAHKVGSGDVFSAMFAHLWRRGASPGDAAMAASRHAAHYVGTRVLPCPAEIPAREPRSMAPRTRVVVVAGDGRASTEWMVAEALSCLADLGAVAADARLLAATSAGASAWPSRFDVALWLPGDGSALAAGVVGDASRAGLRVVAFDDRTPPASPPGCEVVTDFATALYRCAWARP